MRPSGEGIGDIFRRMFYVTAWQMSISRANKDVERAFLPDEGFTFPDLTKTFTGFTFLALLAYGAMNFAVQSPITITPAPTSNIVKITPYEPLTVVVKEPLKTGLHLPVPAMIEEPVEMVIDEPLSVPVEELAKTFVEPIVEPAIEEPVMSEVEALLAEIENLPKPVMTPTVPQSSSVFILAVDKVKKELLVLEETEESFRVVERYKVSYGEKKGDKKREGDLMTPEGVYQIVAVKSDAQLPARYGPGAFVLNYPNDLDRKQGKTGSGIWIHGSGLGENVKDTEGCVEVNDTDIVSLGKFAEKGTPVFIFPEGFKVPEDNMKIDKALVNVKTIYGIKELFKSNVMGEHVMKTPILPADLSG